MADRSAAARNGVPVLDRAMDILAAIERSERGETIRALATQLGLPRSTVYRVLNSFEAHDVVRRTAMGRYCLGARLLALASRVRPTHASYDLVALALPIMHRLVEQNEEPIKLSVRDGDLALVVAAVPGTREYSPMPATGTRYPLHAGAASKLILAHSPPGEVDAFLSRRLERYTPRTVVDPRKLKAELQRIRRQGFARDRGEHGASVHAIAAPVFEPEGRFIAALSIPYLADVDGPTRDRLRDAVVRGAAVISAAVARA